MMYGSVGWMGCWAARGCFFGEIKLGYFCLLWACGLQCHKYVVEVEPWNPQFNCLSVITALTDTIHFIRQA